MIACAEGGDVVPVRSTLCDATVTRRATRRDAHPHCKPTQIHGFQGIWRRYMPGILGQRSVPRERHARRAEPLGRSQLLYLHLFSSYFTFCYLRPPYVYRHAETGVGGFRGPAATCADPGRGIATQRLLRPKLKTRAELKNSN